MMTRLLSMVLLGLLLGLGGCTSVPIPAYAPSYEHVQLLKRAGQPIAVDEFAADRAALSKLSVRGHPLQSPYGTDLVDYIQAAFTSELDKAGLLAENSELRITCRISANDVDGEGASMGHGRIDATFSVMAKGRVAYRKSLSATHAWDSSFVGAIAIPNAAASYPRLVRLLFDQLYADTAFLAALQSAGADRAAEDG